MSEAAAPVEVVVDAPATPVVEPAPEPVIDIDPLTGEHDFGDSDVAEVGADAEVADDAPVEPETPAEPVAEVKAVEPIKADGIKPEATVSKTETVSSKTETTADPFDSQWSGMVTEFNDLRAKFTEDIKSVDPLEGGGKGFEKFVKTTFDALALLDAKIGRSIAPVAQTVQQQQAEVRLQQDQQRAEKYWADFAKATPEIPNPGSAYQAIYKAAVKEFGDSVAADAVAGERWKQHVATVKATPKPVAAKPAIKQPVTKGGAQITPAGGAARPASAKKSPEDELVSAISSGIRDFL